MATKWWDYRFDHPGYCFFEFAKQYGLGVRAWRSKFGVSPYATTRSQGHPIYRKIKGELELTPQSYRTSMWRAMCSADAHGVPYDRWVDWGFDFAFRNRWQRLPGPAMFTNDRMAEGIVRRWEEAKSDLLVSPTNPVYRIENYEAHPTQDAFQDWLLSLISKRPLPHVALANYLSNEPLIVIERAKLRLGEDTVRMACDRI